MISREELKRLKRLGSSRIKPAPDSQSSLYEAVVVDRKGRRKTIGQLATNTGEARRKLERGGAKVLRVKRVRGGMRKGLAFAIKHRIYNGLPYEA